MPSQMVDLQQPAGNQFFTAPGQSSRFKPLLIGTLIVGGLVGAYILFVKNKPVSKTMKKKKKRKTRSKRKSRRR